MKKLKLHSRIKTYSDNQVLKHILLVPVFVCSTFCCWTV